MQNGCINHRVRPVVVQVQRNGSWSATTAAPRPSLALLVRLLCDLWLLMVHFDYV